MKQEEIEANIEEKYRAIPCKYYHTIKGCKRGNKCWFYHDQNSKIKMKSSKLKENKNTKGEPNVEKKLKQEQVVNLNEVFIELVKILHSKKILGLVPYRDCDAPSSVKMKSAFMAKEFGMQPGAVNMCNDKSALTHHYNL